MSTLNRYLLKLFTQHFLIVLGVLISLYGLLDFLEKVDDFIEHRAVFAHYLRYPLYSLPAMLAQTLPMTTLLATFATISLLSRSNQLTALRSCGISLWVISRPLLVFAGALCLAVFLMSNWLTPWASKQAHFLLSAEIKGEIPIKYHMENLYFKDGQRIISVARSLPQSGELQRVVILEFTPDFTFTKRIEALSANYRDEGRWQLNDVNIREFSRTGDLSNYMRQKTLLLELGRRPDELIELLYLPEQMTSAELRQLTTRLASEGRDPQRYFAELHFRRAHVVTPLIMVLLGVPFALQRGRKASIGLGIALSLSTFVVYYALQAIFMALGTAGWLPLPLAAWSANIMLLLVGAWLFLTLDI